MNGRNEARGSAASPILAHMTLFTPWFRSLAAHLATVAGNIKAEPSTDEPDNVLGGEIVGSEAIAVISCGSKVCDVEYLQSTKKLSSNTVSVLPASSRHLVTF